MTFVHRGAWYILGGRAFGEQLSDSSLVYRNGTFQPWKRVEAGKRVFACVARVNETHMFYTGGSRTPSSKDSYKEAYFLEVDTWKWTRVRNMLIGRYDSGF